MNTTDIAALLTAERKKQIAEIVYRDCTLLPGANFYTAAEFAISATLAQLGRALATHPQTDGATVALSDEQIIARCKAAGIKWVPPEPEYEEDGNEVGFPGLFDMVSMSEMRHLLAATHAPAMAEKHEIPWSDCKVAFSVNNEEALWSAWSSGDLALPVGWKLNGTDAAGARCVAIFRVDCKLTQLDGAAVLAEIERIDRAAASGGELGS